ncbi:MAG: UDP-N-acetylglucosamine 2-epimerase (non-hydrolyzing) [Planctomycetes bacterium]|nr:UDP-N-acetylglucosamine 2-epimerase (non-hydrolyzing) [Planctomycetota bacterium]
MARVLLVVGARPNFMKAASVLEAAPRHGLDVRLVDTGQHWDDALTRRITQDLGLPAPHHRLDLGRASGLEQLALLLTGLGRVLEAEAPEMVVVVGDVTSTLAGALAAARAPRPVPLAHVEAGLRSGDRTMPEEVNRLVVDQLAQLLLCTEPAALDNLRREGRGEATALLVGNTMVDTLLRARERAARAGAREALGLAPGGYGLVTLHRPGNVDDPARLEALLGALGQVAARLPLVFPVHPRTRARLGDRLAPERLRLVEPQGYLAFLQLMSSARLVLTDSGGVQEETTALGVPCLTLRESTERPITVTAGTNRVVGTTPAGVVAAAFEALDRAPPAAPPLPPLWDGRAGERIAAAVAGWLAGGPAEARARAVALGAREG